ncbi:hypothetical protein H312_03530 [Anncaliia algerae PRA339]|uniref:FAD/NAD(P)-binding domain-containing protein n=1 Tax=Anncaliia algerae PRA339 TaxID=1288291 RepID=A0A059EW19_9MICR|nr:hypothetical protein H312_03530 [Anncaliia algerae PRA339]
MSVCIIGGGPAGIFTANNLLKYKPIIYDPQPFGKIKSHFLPSPSNKIYEEKMKNILSQCVLKKQYIKNLNELPECSVYVVAIGAEPKKGLGITYDDLIKNKLNPKNAIVIGMGDISFDIARRLTNKVDILGKHTFTESKFSNSLLRNLGKANYVNVMPLVDKENRRNKIALKNHDTGSRISLHFDAFPIEINEKDNKYEVKLKNGSKIEGDILVNATGYQPRSTTELTKNVNKPIYYIGACSNPKGNIGTIITEANDLSEKIKRELDKSNIIL